MKSGSLSNNRLTGMSKPPYKSIGNILDDENYESDHSNSSLSTVKSLHNFDEKLVKLHDRLRLKKRVRYVSNKKKTQNEGNSVLTPV